MMEFHRERKSSSSDTPLLKNAKITNALAVPPRRVTQPTLGKLMLHLRSEPFLPFSLVDTPFFRTIIETLRLQWAVTTWGKFCSITQAAGSNYLRAFRFYCLEEKEDKVTDGQEEGDSILDDVSEDESVSKGLDYIKNHPDTDLDDQSDGDDFFASTGSGKLQTGDVYLARVSGYKVKPTERKEDTKQLLDIYTEHLCSTSFPDNTCRDDFEKKYVQCEKLGEGGFGCVYAGYRTSDNLPVAIKHIRLIPVKTEEIVLNKKKYKIPTEVLFMQRVAGGPESVGKSAAVTLIDWFTPDQEVVLVIERPKPCMDLSKYVKEPLEEQQAKIFMKQLMNAVVDISCKGVYHGDIKLNNILIETSFDVPRLRLIDFGLSLFVGKSPFPATKNYLINSANIADSETVKQVGRVLVDMLGLPKGSSPNSANPLMDGLNILNVTQDCKDFLIKSLRLNPEAERPTLEQLKEHPWINET